VSVTPARPGTAAAILAAALLAASPAFADFTGRVVSVADGDTITVLDSDNHQHGVRIAGNDAPERHQPFGDKSRASMGELASNQEVCLDCRKQDRYHRDGCTVFIAGKDIAVPLTDGELSGLISGIGKLGTILFDNGSCPRCDKRGQCQPPIHGFELFALHGQQRK